MSNQADLISGGKRIEVRNQEIAYVVQLQQCMNLVIYLKSGSIGVIQYLKIRVYIVGANGIRPLSIV
ncbi:MAG: hypothetical protein F6K40_31885 [Okeania sp. SIO3I5]|uniref:hypothetical protein n=1 Tax=Okeania sp. SIO3I5 TaxID=2607805 RepID=UPI0013BE856E|nr:hypothetical protein [Okeania sp. SIO3I5]NEQ40582.1 hypothetical protein [Okeania sp. SIO3I5]